MSDLLSMMASAEAPMKATTAVVVVLLLLMSLRIVRALQRTPVRSREAFGKRARPNSV